MFTQSMEEIGDVCNECVMCKSSVLCVTMWKNKLQLPPMTDSKMAASIICVPGKQIRIISFKYMCVNINVNNWADPFKDQGLWWLVEGKNPESKGCPQRHIES